MRTDITKIYEKMTIRERAEHCFKLCADKDETEMDKVAATVPRYAYNMRDADFIQHFENMMDAAMYWAVLYWKNYAMEVSSILLQQTGRDTMQYGVMYWNQRVTALWLALDTLSDSYGLNPDTVHAIANIKPETHTMDELDEQGEAFYREIIEALKGLLEDSA